VIVIHVSRTRYSVTSAHSISAQCCIAVEEVVEPVHKLHK
jgi:hypothetical protein